MSKTQTTTKVPQEAAAAVQPMPPMKVDVKISSIRPEGNIRAYASINLNDCFAIRNVKVMDGANGLFIAMPSYKSGQSGEYKDICFPVTKAFREQLNHAVIDAYHQTLAQGQNQNHQKSEGSPFDQAPEQDSGMKMAGM
jgi:stage V sporulation protein G